MHTKISQLCLAVLLTALCAGNLNAATENLANDKIAIIYFSQTGNTRSVCEVLARQLPADLIEIKVVKESAVQDEFPTVEPNRVDLTPYRLVVVASPVWMGTLAPAIQAFLTGNRLGDKQVAVVITANVPISDVLQAEHKKLVTEAGGVVVGYYQVSVQEKKEGKGGKGVPRPKDEIQKDSTSIAGEIRKLLGQ